MDRTEVIHKLTQARDALDPAVYPTMRKDIAEVIEGLRSKLVPTPEPPLCCPCCWSYRTFKAAYDNDWYECRNCLCKWNQTASRRAPCPECAAARTEAGIRKGIAEAALARAEAAEARCAEAARMLREWRPGSAHWQDKKLLEVLEARPC